MNFNHGRRGDGGDSVTQGHTGMRIGAGVEEHRAHFAHGCVKAINEFAFVITLKKLHGHAERLRVFAQLLLDVGKASSAIDTCFASAEHIEVGAIQDEYSFHNLHALCKAVIMVSNSYVTWDALSKTAVRRHRYLSQHRRMPGSSGRRHISRDLFQPGIAEQCKRQTLPLF